MALITNTRPAIRFIQSDMPILPGQSREIPDALLEPLKGNAGLRGMFESKELTGLPLSFFDAPQAPNGSGASIEAALQAAADGLPMVDSAAPKAISKPAKS